MKDEHPILFSTPMVQAIMRGEKTQTRRIANPQPDENGVDFMLFPPVLDWEQIYNEGWKPYHWTTDDGFDVATFGRYGVKGSKLWVRETWAKIQGSFCYMASVNEGGFTDRNRGKWKPSIHMPRNASRLLLEVTQHHRIERLHDITESDAKAEGVEGVLCHFKDDPTQGYTSWREGFRKLWDEINFKKAPWESNPWVWVITFKKL